MAVGVREQTCEETVADPGGRIAGERDECDEEGKHPQLRDTGNQAALFDAFGDPCQDQKIDCKQELRWYCQHICVEHRVA